MQTSSDQGFIHIVIGIVKNTNNEVVVTKRRHDVHLGGLLEFPGGRVEAHESPEQALRRELKEELNIDLHECSPLIQVAYPYPDRNVFLDVYTVSAYAGTVTANESQELDWKQITTLDKLDFPYANYGIISALQLPELFVVTLNLSQSPDKFLQCFERVVTNTAISIIQLRSHELNDSQYMQIAEECLKLCRQHHTKLVLNREAKHVKQLNVTGLHLSSKKLLATKARPLENDYIVGASCHNLEEIVHASKLGLDYIFLGPVIEKKLPAYINPLGWDEFRGLVKASLIPVYAIGGLVIGDVKTSVKHGGQGVAAIRDLWART